MKRQLLIFLTLLVVASIGMGQNTTNHDDWASKYGPIVGTVPIIEVVPWHTPVRLSGVAKVYQDKAKGFQGSTLAEVKITNNSQKDISYVGVRMVVTDTRGYRNGAHSSGFIHLDYDPTHPKGPLKAGSIDSTFLVTLPASTEAADPYIVPAPK